MNPHDNIWYVFGVHPHPQGPQRRLLGRVWLKDGNFSVLEDHGIAPGLDLSQATPGQVRAVIERAHDSQRREFINGEDLRQGRHPEALPSTDKSGPIPHDIRTTIQKQLEKEQSAPPKRSFDYHREGMPHPQHLEMEGQNGYLDGQALSPQELQHVMGNLKQGKAKIRHRLGKSDAGLASLAKVEVHLAEALGHVRAQVKAGVVPPEALRTLNRALFSDTMVPSIGNKVAYRDFLSRPREGVHVHIDFNDFKSINETHDHETGNQSIIAGGNGLRQAMDEAVGRKHGKLFRTGGDEFIAFVPTHEHAAHFARSIRSKLEAIPAIRGTHRLSVSVGWGPTPDHAEAALKDAKAAKALAGAVPGQAKTHAASRSPGREGVIPTE